MSERAAVVDDVKPNTPRFGASMDIRFDEGVPEFAAFIDGLGLNHIELRAGYLDARSDGPEPETLRSVAEQFGLTYTVHAPHLDAAPGNVNETLREGTVAAITESIDFAAAIDAGGVVVHGGTARTRYPESVHERSREQAVRTVRESALHAAKRDVPLCLENQRDKDGKHRHTATPERLAAFFDDVGVGSDALRMTLDVGHAKATGIEYESFLNEFADRIHVVHLHDNDGESDAHDPLPSFRSVAERIDAPYNVLEMKSLTDVERCVSDAPP